MDQNQVANWLSKIELVMREGNANRERESKALLQQLEKLADAIKQHGQTQQSEAPALGSQRDA